VSTNGQKPSTASFEITKARFVIPFERKGALLDYIDLSSSVLRKQQSSRLLDYTSAAKSRISPQALASVIFQEKQHIEYEL